MGRVRRGIGVAIALFMLAATQALAATNNVPWTGGSNFDDETITFPGFVANELTNITGSGYYHNHGVATTTFTIEVELDGVWTQIFSDTVPDTDSSDHNLAGIPLPISFPSGTVTGIKITAAPPVFSAFHNFGGEAFTFNGASSDQTERIISNYLERRADAITANEPDLTPRLLGGNGEGGQGPLAFIATGTSDDAHLSFSTSLSRIANAHSAVATSGAGGGATALTESGGAGRFALAHGSSGVVDPDTNGGAAAPLGSLAELRPSFDVWVQGTYSHSDENSRNSDVGLLYAGADYLVTPSLLVGVLAQVDVTNEKDSSVSSSVDGTGWMAGPYVVARLHQNVLFDARVAWGQSFNDISPLGTYTDSFDTERWLAKAQLTGDFRAGNWTFAPHAGVIYFEDAQEAYTDSLGTRIPGQTATLGRVTFGPKVGYTIRTEGRAAIEPYLGLEGIWDFNAGKTVDPTTGVSASSENIRARVEAGVTAIFKHWSISGEGFYDGIGANDLEAYGGRARATIPF